MLNNHPSFFRSTLLCVAPPPVSPTAPPAGPAYLLGYLKEKGCHDFDFLDLRLGVPDAHSPTWVYTGTFGESFVHDIPDLPLVLQLLRIFDDGDTLIFESTDEFQRYCMERSISSNYLRSYVNCLSRYFERVFSQIPKIEFIGFTTWTTNYFATLLAAAHLKRRKKPPFIIVGGPQVTASFASGRLGLHSGLFDLVALGEGEETLLESYQEFKKTGDVSPGRPGTLSLSSDGEFLHNERTLSSINLLPPPSFDGMHLEAYQTEEEYRIVPLQFSRGCTDRCSFCSEWKFWKRFRPDTVEHLIEHIKYVQKNYGANFIHFMDSLLNGVPDRLVAFAEAVVKERIKIGWSAFMRAQMTPEVAKLLARSGCHDVFVGVESFSDETLKMMKKRRTKAHNLLALEAFLEAGIFVTIGFIPGFPGDSRSSFLGSTEVLKDLLERYPEQLSMQNEPFSAQPNSPLYDDLESSGLKPVYWGQEYINIAPRYADLTSTVICSVEGESQGLERVGRTEFLQSISADASSNNPSQFMRAHDEEFDVDSFDMEYLEKGWHLARKKSDFAHTFGLLVNDEERDEMEGFSGLGDPTDKKACALLKRLAARHAIPPSETGPLLLRGLYHKNDIKENTYALSPFIIGRWIGPPSKRQLLLTHTFTSRWWLKSFQEGRLIHYFAKKPMGLKRMLARVKTQKLKYNAKSISPLILNLTQDGVLVITDSSKV